MEFAFILLGINIKFSIPVHFLTRITLQFPQYQLFDQFTRNKVVVLVLLLLCYEACIHAKLQSTF